MSRFGINPWDNLANVDINPRNGHVNRDSVEKGTTHAAATNPLPIRCI